MRTIFFLLILVHALVAAAEVRHPVVPSSMGAANSPSGRAAGEWNAGRVEPRQAEIDTRELEYRYQAKLRQRTEVQNSLRVYKQRGEPTPARLELELRNLDRELNSLR